MEMLAPVADRTGWSGLFSFDVVADTGEHVGETVARTRLRHQLK
jgi:hypothetical protein